MEVSVITSKWTMVHRMQMSPFKNMSETRRVSIYSLHTNLINLIILLKKVFDLLIQNLYHSRLCGPKGYQPCPADAPDNGDPWPDWVDGKNTGFEDQGLSQGVTSTTPDPNEK